MAGIYIHIPFCSKACNYCDFHFSTNHSLVLEIGKAIINELELQRDYLGTEHIETIYLGGGTPSILDSSTIEKLLKSVYKNFTVVPGSEVTLEANPEDITFEKLRELKSIGINRLSVGVQTFNDAVLKFLNRSHNGKQAKQSIEIARKAGYTNLNLDLIYAIPGRDYKNLEQDLIQIIDLIPEHISAYSLTIEKNTVFGKWADIRKLKIVSDEENASQFEIVFDKLHEAGYDHYEISNYAKPGFASIHNTNYWRQKKYLGVGPSAHSYNGFNRQANVSNNNSYLRSIQLGSIPATVEELKREDLINEYIMISLRTKWGCNLNYLKVEYQFDLMGSQPNSIQWAIENGLMELNELTLKLTQSGKMHADKLSSDLFLIN
jgi:oxygen-independent coproporphyrinogen-3 oxidase